MQLPLSRLWERAVSVHGSFPSRPGLPAIPESGCFLPGHTLAAPFPALYLLHIYFVSRCFPLFLLQNGVSLVSLITVLQPPLWVKERRVEGPTPPFRLLAVTVTQWLISTSVLLLLSALVLIYLFVCLFFPLFGFWGFVGVFLGRDGGLCQGVFFSTKCGLVKPFQTLTVI